MKKYIALFIVTCTTQLLSSYAMANSICPCKFMKILDDLKEDGITITSAVCTITYNRSIVSPPKPKPTFYSDISMNLTMSGQGLPHGLATIISYSNSIQSGACGFAGPQIKGEVQKTDCIDDFKEFALKVGAKCPD